MGKANAMMLFIAFMMVSMSWFQVLDGAVEILDEHSTEQVDQRSRTAFSNGASELSQSVGNNPIASLPLEPGYRLEDGTMNIALEGQKITSSQLFSVASGTLNGTLTDTVSDGSAIQLMSTSSGPPGAGSNSSQLFNTVTWSGTHNYSTLELRCGIASCGKIVASGDLTLYVNTLIVEQGSMIESDDLISGGTGAGSGTTTPSNGRNDGGGGAGHGGAGGAGGGTNGGSGGSSYGNGTERGSQGGGVSSSYHSAVSGGLGGGYIRIFADAIYVNGSIQTNGGNGDSGSQASGGTGPGGSGGGGGSGGSIFIQSNTLSVGTYGTIRANGGDGGDGANGAQNGPGFGMYDGGDGGGGGAGGRITVKTQTGGLSNSGVIQASGGAGGSKGLKYGTGVDGVDGYAGSNGVVSTQTWQGYVSQSNLTTNDGSFITQPIQLQTSPLSEVIVNHQAVVPASARIDVQYRWTINGTNASFTDWSTWQDTNLSTTQYHRMKWVQFAYTFNRTGSASPTLSSIQVETSQWTTLSNAQVSYDGQPTSFALQQTSLGFVNQIQDNSSGQNHAVSIHLPRDATILEDIRFWMNWDNSAGSTVFQGASIGASELVNATKSHRSEGIDVAIDHQTLNNQFFQDTWMGADGLEWRTLLIDLNFSGSTSIEISDLWLPFSIETQVNLTSAVNNAVVSACGSIYLSTAQTCLGTDYSHPISVTGQVQPTGSPTFDFTLSMVSLDYIDDVAPEVLSIEHRKGVVSMPNVRVGDTFSIILFDKVEEDDLTVEYLGTDWQESDGYSNALSLSYTSILKAYYLNFDTSAFDPVHVHTLNMTFRMVDSNSNEQSVHPTYSMTLHPAAPETTSLSINGPTLLSGTQTDGIWEVEQSNFEFDVTSAFNRSDLQVGLSMQKQGGQTQQLTLQWNESSTSYQGDWTPVRDDIGIWTIEVDMAEPDGLLGSDMNGLLEGADAEITLMDANAPQILSVSYDQQLQLDDVLEVQIEWLGNIGETSSGWVSIHDESDEVRNKSILQTSQTTTSLQFDLAGLENGMYFIHVYLIDDQGNDVYIGATTYAFDIQPPLVTGEVALQALNSTSIELSGNLLWKSGMGTVTVSSSDEAWSEVVALNSGVFMQAFDIGEPTSSLMTFDVTACDSQAPNECETTTFELDFSSAFIIDIDAMCQSNNVATTDTDQLDLVICQVINNGATRATAGFNHSLSSLASNQPIDLLPGQTTSMTLVLLNGSTELNLSYTWSIYGQNSYNQVLNIESGSHLLSRTISSDIEEEEQEEDEVVTSTSGTSSQLLTLVFFVILAFLGGSVFTVRMLKQRTSETITDGDLAFEKEFDQEFYAQDEGFDTALNDPSVESIATEDLSGAPVDFTPSVDQQPTSYDEHGFEWYTNDNMHWYRQRDSQSEWTKY
jgi:hypothetical protein